MSDSEIFMVLINLIEFECSYFIPSRSQLPHEPSISMHREETTPVRNILDGRTLDQLLYLFLVRIESWMTELCGISIESSLVVAWKANAAVNCDDWLTFDPSLNPVLVQLQLDWSPPTVCLYYHYILWTGDLESSPSLEDELRWPVTLGQWMCCSSSRDRTLFSPDKVLNFSTLNLRSRSLALCNLISTTRWCLLAISLSHKPNNAMTFTGDIIIKS